MNNLTLINIINMETNKIFIVFLFQVIYQQDPQIMYLNIQKN